LARDSGEGQAPPGDHDKPRAREGQGRGDDAIAFGEKLLTLLDAGFFTATYKYGVILALLDLCLEYADRDGAPPSSLTTSQLAQKTIELYWPQTLPFGLAGEGTLLRQSSSGQAQIVSRIVHFREAAAPDPLATLHRTRLASPKAFARLVDFVEWKLIEMPLPRLQQLGRFYEPFIYQIGWDVSITRSQASGSEFDNRLLLLPGAGEHLVRLAGLIRPLVQREWAAMVARMNRGLVEDSQLEDFLFGARRAGAGRLAFPLRELQENRCFYCGEVIKTTAAVDHFLPWVRYPDDGVENLVAAHAGCNGSKRDFLAAEEHVTRWAGRFAPGAAEGRQLAEIAELTRWQRHPERTLSVARAVYLNLSPGVKLWAGIDLFEDADLSGLERALAG